MATSIEAAVESLREIKSKEPPMWLVPKQELSQAVRAASKHLFSSLKPHSPKSPFDQLLIEGFDAEQIWQQIDLQSQPLLYTLRREVKKFEKNPEEISKLKEAIEGGKKKKVVEEKGTDDIDDDDDDDDDLDMDDDDDYDDDEEEEEKKERGREEESEREGEEMELEGEEKGGIEDKFLKIKELQEYLEEDEAKEYGLKKNKKTKTETKKKEEDTEEEEEGEDEEEEEEEDDDNDEAEEEEDELGLFDGDDEDDEDSLENARYEDFFGTKKNKGPKEKAKSRDRFEGDSGSDDEQDFDKRKDGLSTHEEELKKLQSKIEQMEKANLDPKVWTMRGEVTAAQRQKNSALEVDLDFEHNVRPAPVITEEVTASLEDLIKTRISEGLFDDVQKSRSLSSKAPRETKELDDNKSKKGLAEVYEEEFVQKTDPAAAPLSFSDELKKEASMLFKKLCLKLDALSHFHFTPKPVVEDMSIQTNVPALAMEEIAPMAVSDAAMLAPEEVFAGKGDIKEEAELTRSERKRRRANKKRKFKAEAAKRLAKKPRETTQVDSNEGDYSICYSSLHIITLGTNQFLSQTLHTICR
ncbi:U3 small nucleolar ribonucleoprotein mpp10 isoform 4 [Theobroma cacao]|uniref:U3 small nucleolar ribonucleoprotein protein MPP10 n=1 Tax=Theobroma cacao TaxID=3641 RepID=A0A061FU83_THECC|nr:U3 small nucleolar ribonucleoprotein mpp10 isoform 4 [Theobroma cacao]